MKFLFADLRYWSTKAEKEADFLKAIEDREGLICQVSEVAEKSLVTLTRNKPYLMR